jgi:hypothetical protein
MIHPLVLIFQLATIVLSGAAILVQFPSLDPARDTDWEHRSLADRLHSITLYYTVGCAALSLLFALAGHLRLDAVSLTLVAAVPALSALFHLRSGWFRPTLPGIPAGLMDRLVLGAVVVMATLGFLGSLSPEVRHDPLFYHVEVPRLWLNFGRMVEVPENGHSYFPYGFEMLYTWSLSLGSDSAAKGLHWAAGLAAAGWCARLARGFRANPLHAAALFYFIHFVSYLSTTTYIDLATAMYGLAAVTLWAERRASPWDARTALAFGFFTGSAMATKYTAWPLIGVPLGVAAAFSLWRSPRLLLLTGFAALLPLAPWVARNLAYVGNPVAPLMVRVFGPQSAIDTGLAGSFDSFSGAGWGVQALLVAPLVYARHLVLQKYTLSLLGIVTGAILLAMERRAEPGRRDALRSLFLLLVGLFLAEALFTRGHPDGRYGLTTMGVGAVLLAAFCGRLAATATSPRACLVAPALCLALFASGLVDYWKFQRDLHETWLPVLTESSRDRYRYGKGVQPGHHAELEKLLTDGHAGRVLGVGYPSRHRYWVWIQGMRNDLVSAAGGASADAESIHRALGQLDFTHVVDARNPGFDAARWEEFLRVYTEPVAAPYADVRRIK